MYRCRSACVESTDADSPLRTRNFGCVVVHTYITDARQKMGGLYDSNHQCFRKTRFWVCLSVLACEVPRALYRPCKMMKWRDQRDRFEEESSSESISAHPESCVHLSVSAHSHTVSYIKYRIVGTHVLTHSIPLTNTSATHFCPTEGHGGDQTSVFSGSQKRSP